jgi:sugar diacid utilization regulator
VLVAGSDVASSIDRIAGACPAGTLSGFRSGHVVLLVPAALPDPERLEREAEGATIACGRPVAPGHELVTELRHTEVLLDVALARGSLGVLGPDDLLLDQLLAGNPRVASALERLVLGPLRDGDRGGVLEETLRAYLGTGSVPATAKVAIVHPNTVAYRLARVADRTGLDPRVPAEAALLALALRL